MDLIKYFCVILLLGFANYIEGFYRPHRLQITGVDFKFLLKWDVASIKGSSLMRASTDFGRTFTVYRRIYNVAYYYNYNDNVGNEDQGYWIPGKGCTNVRGKQCELQEMIEYMGEHEFWVAASSSPTDLSFADAPSDQKLIYSPENEMTFSAPKFTAIRNGSSIEIKFRPKTSKLLHGVTVVDFLMDWGYEPRYEIDYYERLDVNTIPNQSKHHKTISASTIQYNLTTSFPENAIICVSIRFIDDKFSEKKSPAKEVCDPEDNDDAPPIDQWILAGICALLGLFVVMAVVMFCSRNGYKIFRKAFSLRDIEIPEKTDEILNENATLKAATMLLDDTVPSEIVDPCWLNASELSAAWNIKKSNASPSSGHEYLQSNYENHCLTQAQSENMAQDDQRRVYKNSSSSSYAKMIFYEHKPGAYICDSVFTSDHNKNNLVNSHDPSMTDQRQVMLDDFDQSSRSRNVQRQAPKRRYLSEDSAFFDDVALLAAGPSDIRLSSTSSGSL